MTVDRPGRALGVDLGAQRIGLSLSDPAGILATPYDTIRRAGDPAAERRAIVAAAQEAGAVTIVVGLPRALSGKLGTAAKSALAEVEALRELTRDLGIEVDTYDERFTTMIAQQGLQQAHPRKQRRQKAKREQVDAAAATVLLQSWLDARSAGS
ncbi:MAG: Holliday junction resolvase RuvX [Acidimicrobiia bacterium]